MKARLRTYIESRGIVLYSIYSHLYRFPVVRNPTTANNTNWGNTRRPITKETAAPTAKMLVTRAG